MLIFHPVEFRRWIDQTPLLLSLILFFVQNFLLNRHWVRCESHDWFHVHACRNPFRLYIYLCWKPRKPSCLIHQACVLTKLTLLVFPTGGWFAIQRHKFLYWQFWNFSVVGFVVRALNDSLLAENTSAMQPSLRLSVAVKSNGVFRGGLTSLRSWSCDSMNGERIQCEP